jgi:UDP-N-acetylglucosamine diphosphorylase/glucosamine-1-phosphate N-acetyltransferase
MIAAMHVVIYEGRAWPTFAPLCLNRPVFMLSTGMATLFDKQIRYLNASRITLWVRPELVDFCRTRVIPQLKIPAAVNVPLDDQPALLVSGRTLLFRPFTPPAIECVSSEDQMIRIAHATRPGLSHEDVMNRTDRWLELTNLEQVEPEARLVQSLADLISWNEESLIEDSIHLLKGAKKPPMIGPFTLIEEEDIWIGDDAHIQPGVILDASRGPIVIGTGAKIGANSVIEGPCYLGPAAQVRPLSYIKDACTIGRLCKVGGEVNNSIMLGHSNKAHDGFLGHSYLGKWVNLGAGTTTANLKSTYGTISLKIGSKEIPTDRQFLGALIGDHVKTAINTRLMPGSYIGFCTTVAGSSIAPRFLPSFTFWSDKGAEPMNIEVAKRTMKAVYARRDIRWTEGDEKMVSQVQNTAPEVEK